ncbi:B3 domain-containing protein Os01g0234100-like [Primulina eburnea]|uniref:B3 domain-containing protein Os01g0234100-like n=1 Tax=Primulina eburnea TaxID=1245227 RepID=UPI003C6C140B
MGMVRTRSGGGISTSKGSVVKFQDAKQFKDFKICVDALVVDSELPAFEKLKYYELCCSQKMFLHGHLIQGLGSKLVVAMICKTANIAAAIKSLSLVPSLQDLKRWDITLKSFEDLGMGVGFLRARIDKLVEISRKYETVNESWYAIFEHVEEKTRALKKEVSTMDALAESIAGLKASIESVEDEMDAIKEEMKDIDTEYFEAAAAPW